jgi:hypothetical protein
MPVFFDYFIHNSCVSSSTLRLLFTRTSPNPLLEEGAIQKAPVIRGLFAGLTALFHGYNIIY